MTVQELIEKMSSGKDPELLHKIAACRTEDEAYEAAEKAGLTTPKNETLAEFRKWQKQVHELSESDLEKTAGGQLNNFGWVMHGRKHS